MEMELIREKSLATIATLAGEGGKFSLLTMKFSPPLDQFD
jgi:hypothetical protein